MTTTPELLALRDLCARIEAAGIGYMLTGSLDRDYLRRWAAHLGVERLLEEAQHD